MQDHKAKLTEATRRLVIMWRCSQRWHNDGSDINASPPSVCKNDQLNRGLPNGWGFTETAKLACLVCCLSHVHGRPLSTGIHLGCSACHEPHCPTSGITSSITISSRLLILDGVVPHIVCGFRCGMYLHHRERIPRQKTLLFTTDFFLP